MADERPTGPDPDLYDNPSPFADGSPAIDLQQTSAFPQGGAPGYYVPVASSPTGNPWTQGIPAREDEAASRYAADTLDAAYASAVRYQSGGTDTAPTLDDYSIDEGLDDQIIPIDRRR